MNDDNLQVDDPGPSSPLGHGASLHGMPQVYSPPEDRYTSTSTIQRPVPLPLNPSVRRAPWAQSSRGLIRLDDRDHGQGLTVSDRLEKTLDNARKQRVKAAKQAHFYRWSVNAAIGLQVMFGALTTAVAAASSGRQASIGVSVIGGLSTLVASYLARARGTGEPETSTALTKLLDHFIREVEDFKEDHAHESGLEWDEEIKNLRKRFEELMGSDERWAPSANSSDSVSKNSDRLSVKSTQKLPVPV